MDEAASVPVALKDGANASAKGALGKAFKHAVKKAVVVASPGAGPCVNKGLGKGETAYVS